MANLIDDAQRAERLAVAIANDLRLYNEDKIKSAKSLEDLLTRALAEEIGEGRMLYQSRVAPGQHALFDTVLRRVLGEAWL